MFTHILLEVYCKKNHEKGICEDSTPLCESKNNIPQYSCLLNKCPFVMFTSHENALCYINQNSEAEEIISLGGEMCDAVDESSAKLLWEEIAKQKIDEAYTTYMSKVQSPSNQGTVRRNTWDGSVCSDEK